MLQDTGDSQTKEVTRYHKLHTCSFSMSLTGGGRSHDNTDSAEITNPTGGIISWKPR